MAGLLSIFSKKGNEAPDPKSIAKAVPAGSTIRKRNGYGAYAADRQTQGKPVLSLSDWMAGKPDADDDDNELTTRLK